MGNDKESGKFLAIIFACYNRIEKTRACIDSLQQQLAKLPIQYQFYICDDHSSDGTPEMLRRRLPNAILIRTKGNYYWSKSMQVAMNAARKDNPDYYLMVNDDVLFHENAIAIMLASYHRASSRPCGIVGTTVSSENGNFTYGGRQDDNAKIIKPSSSLPACKVANWNCFLVDARTIAQIGIIDGRYEHGGGDYDYCYRMKKAGIPIYIAYDIIGQCEANTVAQSFLSAGFSRRERLKAYFSRKGLPFRSTIRYNYKTKGFKGLWDVTIGYLYGITMIVMKKDLTRGDK